MEAQLWEKLWWECWTRFYGGFIRKVTFTLKRNKKAWESSAPSWLTTITYYYYLLLLPPHTLFNLPPPNQPFNEKFSDYRKSRTLIKLVNESAIHYIIYKYIISKPNLTIHAASKNNIKHCITWVVKYEGKGRDNNEWFVCTCERTPLKHCYTYWQHYSFRVSIIKQRRAW